MKKISAKITTYIIKYHDAASGDEAGSEKGLLVYWLLQEDEGEADGYHHAELVDGSHTAHVAQLDSLEIEEP